MPRQHITWEEPTVRVAVMPPGSPDAKGRRSVGWTLALNGSSVTAIDAGDRGRGALFTLVERMHRELIAACIAEHQNGLHQAGPEIGCPRCADAESDEPAEVVARLTYSERAARRHAVGLPAPAPQEA
ncbi:hypothetical protein [Pseudonocardia sp. T1-2H]|uniref:hypothetical protein n=1 Tax=Pseudonocardia sp. T1-2H TaxID=3128899 RepID=UPI003100F85E